MMQKVGRWLSLYVQLVTVMAVESMKLQPGEDASKLEKKRHDDGARMRM